MGFFRGPNIVRDSLLYHVDASSPRSYPGTGTTWYDISGNGNDFTIYGNPTWDSEGFQLDEVVDHMECDTIPTIGTSMSVEAWYQFHQTDAAYGPIVTRWQTGANTNNEFFLGNNDGSPAPGYPSFGVDNTIGTDTSADSLDITTTGVWYHQFGTWDGTYTRVYINGVLKDTSPVFTGTINEYTTQPVAIGAFGDQMESGSALYEAAIKIRSSRMYSRALTGAEILQNFEAQRGRYGI